MSCEGRSQNLSFQESLSLSVIYIYIYIYIHRLNQNNIYTKTTLQLERNKFEGSKNRFYKNSLLWTIAEHVQKRCLTKLQLERNKFEASKNGFYKNSLRMDNSRTRTKTKLIKYLGSVWYMCLKTENCCLKIFMEIRVGEKMC